MARISRGDADLPPGPARDLVDLFRLLRSRSPLTLGQLMVRSGLTAGHLSEVLRGWKAPSPGSAAAIAQALGADDATTARARVLAESLAELNRYLRAQQRGPGRQPVRAPQTPAKRPGPRPAQLRRALPTAQFIGRAAQLGVLDHLVQGTAAEGRLGSAAIVVIHGMAGIGKTQLGLFWAHRHRADFPGGQLFADLHGFEPGSEPATASNVLRSMVRDLGLAPHMLGEGEDELVSQFRTLTEGRRLLIFLDNVRDAAQVEPLIPASEDCLVLITSRTTLTDLEGVDQRIGLGLLGVPEAMSLLAASIGADFIEASPGRAGQLVEATGRLTLALQVAAWRIAARNPHQRKRELDRVLAELAGNGAMAALDGASSQDRQLTAVLTGSYHALPAEARQLFRAFAALPGAEFSGEVAGVLASPDDGDPKRALDTIVAAHLADPVTAGRYRLHDLVKAFVRQLAGGDADYQAASARICSWYVHAARNADEALRPGRIRPGLLPLPSGVSCAGFGDSPAAFRWLDAEHDNLAATVAHGIRDGHGAIVWRLPLDMWGYLTQSRRWEQWVVPHRLAAEAAAAAGQPSGQGWLLNNLGTAYRHLGAAEAAQHAFAAGLAVRRGIGDLHGEADSLKDMALAARLAGDLAEAVRLSEAALDVMSRLDVADLSGTASSLDNIGAALTALGRLDEAAEARLKALRQWDDIGGARDDRAIARCTAGLAEIAWLRRDGPHAESLYLQSLSTFEAIADRWGQVDALRGLGEVTADAAPARARDYWERARAIVEELGADDAAEQVAARLAALGRAPTRRSGSGGGNRHLVQPGDSSR